MDGKIIEEENSNKTLKEFQLGNEYYLKIKVFDTTTQLIGAGPKMMEFIDVSSGIIKRLEFSQKAPIWRKVSKGLNIFGICENSMERGSNLLYIFKRYRADFYIG